MCMCVSGGGRKVVLSDVPLILGRSECLPGRRSPPLANTQNTALIYHEYKSRHYRDATKGRGRLLLLLCLLSFLIPLLPYLCSPSPSCPLFLPSFPHVSRISICPRLVFTYLPLYLCIVPVTFLTSGLIYFFLL